MVGVISFPFSSFALQTSKRRSTVEAVMKSVDSAICLPGQTLRFVSGEYGVARVKKKKTCLRPKAPTNYITYKVVSLIIGIGL